MKVLVIEPCFVNFGGYFRSYNLSLALSKKGVKVDLLVSSRENFKFSIKKTQFNENFRQYELPRFNIYYLFNGRLLRAFIGLMFGLFGRYDIIHACVPTQLEANIPAFFLKLIGKKVVMDWDDYFSGSPIFQDLGLIKKYVQFCEKKAPRYFENIVVVSDFLAGKATQWGAKKMVKVINAIPKDQYRMRERVKSFEELELDSAKKYLLCIGNTYFGDRIVFLFKTFEAIHKLNPDIKLICNFNHLEKIKEHNLEEKISPDCLKNVIGMGYLSDENLERCFSICDAAIFLQGKTEDEIACFPIRIGSYLSAEVIILINDTGSEASNTLKAYGCAIVEKNLDDLAKETVNVLSDKELYLSMKNKVVYAKNELSWDNQIKKLIKFYEELK